MDAGSKSERQRIAIGVIADWMLGSSHYVLGNPATLDGSCSRADCAAVREAAAGKGEQLARALLPHSRAVRAGSCPMALRLPRPRLAKCAGKLLRKPRRPARPVNVSYSLVYCCYVFLWAETSIPQQEMIEKVMAQPHWQGRLVWFHAEALALQGELLVRRGNLEEGIELLRRVLADMQASRQKNLMQTVTACCLAEGLAAAGRTEEALAVIDECHRSFAGRHTAHGTGPSCFE